MPLAPYPSTPAERDRWIVGRRGPKAALDPRRAYAQLWEEEYAGDGMLAPTAVVFITNAECPFRCVMCDLWRHTLDGAVRPGAVPAQIAEAVAALPPARHIKLYNSGNFFDPRAIPPADYGAIATAVRAFDRVIVEAHPAFLAGDAAERCLRFRDLLPGSLEVAIGLETAHPGALERLNKRMTVEGFRRAATFLAAHGIALRVFVILGLPFIERDEQAGWTMRSIECAMDAGATACSVIPMRPGNGAVDLLDTPVPTLRALEAAVEHGLSLRRGRVFADLWDVDRLFDCTCSPGRVARLAAMNRTQQPPPPVTCACQQTT